MRVNTFAPLTYDELMPVDGGFTWRGFGGAVAAGGVTGGLAGASAGAGVGGIAAAPGALSGALIAEIAYCITDIVGS